MALHTNETATKVCFIYYIYSKAEVRFAKTQQQQRSELYEQNSLAIAIFERIKSGTNGFWFVCFA